MVEYENSRKKIYTDTNSAEEIWCCANSAIGTSRCRATIVVGDGGNGEYKNEQKPS